MQRGSIEILRVSSWKPIRKMNTVFWTGFRVGYNNLCSISYGWYDQVPGLIGNVERVRYSSGLNATGGPSAKKDGSMVGLEVFFLSDCHPIISLPVHHTTTILKWFTVFLIKQSCLFLVYDLLFLKLCYRQLHINNNEGYHLKKYSNNDPE